MGSWTSWYCHPCHFTHSELFPHPSWIELSLSTKCKGTVTHLLHNTAPTPAPKRGIRHVSGISVGLVLSSMPFHPLRTLPPSILDSTEVIHTVYGNCKGNLTRLHRNTAPPPALKCGISHVSGILNGLVLSYMPFHPFRTLPPPILDCTEVIHTV